MPSDCDIIESLSDEAIWAHLEGSADNEVVECIRSHCVRCRACFVAYAEGMGRVKQQDPKRYARFHNENLAVRKLELERYCKNNGIPIDITKIKTAEDYHKFYLSAAFKGLGPIFQRWWDKITPEKRDEIILELVQILEDEDQESE